MSKSFFRIIFAVALFLPLQIVNAESLRVTPEWLKSHLQDKNLVILDTRPLTDYEADHISGALSFPDALTYQQKTNGGKIVEPDVMQGLLRERGINNNNTIIVYDAGQIIDAARVFWALEVYGLNVKILTSGYDYWIKNNYPISKTSPTVSPSKYVPKINHHRIASKFTTQLATKNSQQIVVDARGPDAYNGKKSSAKRFGHIPTAINIPVSRNIKKVNGIKTLRSLKELKEVYSELPKDNKIVLYCEIARISSTNYFSLRELGYNPSNYDASWREWGNDLSLPIEK